VRLTVDDDGSGISPDQYERVFEEGVSSKSVPDAGPGTAATLRRRGIGLALVRRVVERSGGRVTVDRSELGGARFTVELPLGAGLLAVTP
jgi:two-component system CitB family sensor kinase